MWMLCTIYVLAKEKNPRTSPRPSFMQPNKCFLHTLEQISLYENLQN